MTAVAALLEAARGAGALISSPLVDAAWERPSALAQMTVGDDVMDFESYLATRIVELLVHTDDLARAAADADRVLKQRPTSRLLAAW